MQDEYRVSHKPTRGKKTTQGPRGAGEIEPPVSFDVQASGTGEPLGRSYSSYEPIWAVSMTRLSPVLPNY